MNAKYAVSCKCTGQEQIIATIDDDRPDGGITVIPFRAFTKDGYTEVNRHGGTTQYHVKCECKRRLDCTDQTLAYLIDQRIKPLIQYSQGVLLPQSVRRWESFVEPELSDAEREERKEHTFLWFKAMLSGAEPPPADPRWELKATFVAEDRYVVDLGYLNEQLSNIDAHRE